MANFETNPNFTYEFHKPKEGELKFVRGLLHRFEWCMERGEFDWFMVPNDGIPDGDSGG